MTIEQAIAKLQYLSYNVTLESGEQMIIIEKDDVFEVLDKVVKNRSIPDVNERLLLFKSIYDLIGKVENIKMAHKIKSETFRQILKEKEIKFTPIDDYGVSIDVALLSKEDKRFIETQGDSFIENVYKENGVVLNVPTTVK